MPETKQNGVEKGFILLAREAPSSLPCNVSTIVLSRYFLFSRLLPRSFFLLKMVPNVGGNNVDVLWGFDIDFACISWECLLRKRHVHKSTIRRVLLQPLDERFFDHRTKKPNERYDRKV
ncbi:hypothetical protein L2E82_01306 [Cichorium intybus]|uniref:Uncharacterized protein n=1 Tax=Cichorium intybus TaxID=13427 RepID=A0ACB9GYY0_CICIN|nr:hypothetical protein L2E82_01306 [Cichorium intybus]